MFHLKRLLDPYKLIKCLQDDFFTSRRFPQDISHAAWLPALGLNRLPNEVLVQILNSFNPGSQRSLVNLSSTCRRLCKLVQPYLFADVVIRRSNLDLVRRALLVKPERKTLIRGFILEIHYIKVSYGDSFGQRYKLARDFAEVFTGCFNLEWVELRRGQDDRLWRCSEDGFLLKQCLMPLTKIPSLRTLEFTEGFFYLIELPVFPYVESVYFSFSPRPDYNEPETPWTRFPNLKILQIATFESEEAQVLFYDLAEEEIELSSAIMTVAGHRINMITNLVLETPISNSADEICHFTFNLREDCMLGSPIAVYSEIYPQAINTVRYIVLACQPEAVTLVYSMPDHWLPSYEAAYPSEWRSALLSETETSSYDELDSIEPLDILSEDLRRLSKDMRSFATELEKSRKTLVDVVFVEKEAEFMAIRVLALREGIYRFE